MKQPASNYKPTASSPDCAQPVARGVQFACDFKRPVHFGAGFLTCLSYVSRLKISRFMLVGALCALLNNAIIIVLSETGVNYLAAAVAAFPVIAILAYLLHTRFTVVTPRSKMSFFRFALAGTTNFPFWTAAMFVV